MKHLKMILILSVVAIFLNSCINDDEWNPNEITVVTLNNDNPFYHFSKGLFLKENMPNDIDEYGIINEPWCTDLPALCGNFEVTDKTEFADFDVIPAGDYESTCEEVPLNKVLVFKLGDNSFALVKVINDIYNATSTGCEHVINLHINYPALEGLDSEEPGASGISEGVWSFATETTGQVVLGLSSFNKSGSGVYVAGYVPGTSFSGHVGEVRYESNSYLREISTPGYFNPLDVVCRNDFQINVCGNMGEFARYEDLSNKWEYDVQISENYFRPESMSFPTDNYGYVASENEVFKTVDGGRNWQKCFDWERGGKIFFTSQSVGYLLKKIGTDEGRLYKTTNSGTDFTPYTFPLHWYGQPSVTNVYSLFFLDENRGWICADYGQIIATTNGGKDWQIIRHGGETEPHLFDIEFTNENEGWACGSTGTLLRTTDGGTTWNNVDVGETADFIAIEFNSPYYGWVATSGKVYYYQDRARYIQYFR